MSLPNNISHVKLAKRFEWRGRNENPQKCGKIRNITRTADTEEAEDVNQGGSEGAEQMLAVRSKGQRKTENLQYIANYYVIVWTCTDFASQALSTCNISRFRARIWPESGCCCRVLMPNDVDGAAELLSVLSRRITYIIDTLTLASNWGLQVWAMTDRILVLFKMALNHGSRLAQENAETGTHTTRNRMCSRLKG